MKINKKYYSKTKMATIAVIACLVVAGLYLALALHNHYPPFMAQKTATKTNTQTVNLQKSDAEKQKTQELQSNPASKTENSQTDTPAAPTNTTPSGKQSVNVLITNASITNNTVKASGFVTNLAEEGGVCTYVFTSGSSTITKTSTTLVNPTSTTCETVTFSADELPVSGNWSVVLSYSSAGAEGTSSAKDFTK